MTLNAEVYWSFRSPYSYLATPRLVAIEREWDIAIAVKPVYPLAKRTPEFFDQVNPLWPPYLMRDTYRLAQMMGIPFHWPMPDPIAMDMKTRRPLKDQPLVTRLTHLGIAAVERGRGLPFIDEISRLIWNGATQNWDQGDHLAQAAKRAGLDLAELEKAIADEAGYAAKVEANQQTQLAAGHWGVPLLVFENEPFFGQDRIDVALWRMKQRGLKKRA